MLFFLRSSCYQKSFELIGLLKLIWFLFARKKQQNKRFLSQLDETVDNSIIANLIAGVEHTNIFDRGHEIFNCYNPNHSTTESGSQVDMQTLEKNISHKLRSEVENVAAVETSVYEAILSAMDNLVISRMELAMRSVGISSACNPSSAVCDPDEKDFSGITNGLQMTASSRFNSTANFNGIDEARGNITVEEGDLPVSERNPDRETHAHHISIHKLFPLCFLLFDQTPVRCGFYLLEVFLN